MYRWVKSCCGGCGCLILELFDSTEQQKHMVHWISVISFDQSFIRTWPVREGGKLTKVYFLVTTEERPAGSRKYFARHIVWIYTQMCTRQRNMGYDQYTVPDDCSCRTYFCCSALALANIRPWPPVPFFQISLMNSELKTTHNTFRDCRVIFFRQPSSKSNA